MENRANYALIGLFVLLALTAAAGFGIWLTGAQFDREYDTYEVSFSGGVRGLNKGSEVRFNGLSVGEVTNLRYDEDDPNTVLADIQIAENTPIDTRAVAQLTPLGLTGMNYIEIEPGGPDFPMLDDLPGRGIKRIVGEASQIDIFIDGGGDVITAVQTALVRVNRVLSDDAVADFHGILTNLREITESVDLSELDANRLNLLMDDFSEAAKAIRDTANNITQTSTTIDTVVAEDLRQLLGRAETTLAGVDETVGSFGEAAVGADELIVDARDAINRLSNSGLTDLEETVDAIRRLVTTLGRVADNLEQSPTEFIVGAEREEVVLPQ